MGSLARWQDVGARVGEARRAARLTQAQLAECLGLERSAVSEIESGTRRIGALELTKLADGLGLPVDHFLTARVPVLSHRQPLTELDESDVARSAFRTETQLSSWLRDVRQLRGLGVLPERELWGYPGKASDSTAYRTAARWVRERLGNAKDPLGSMAEVCARAGQWPPVAAIPGDGCLAHRR